MASRSIYPPIVNSYEPAFVAGSNSTLRVYFSLSSLSSSASTFLTSVSDTGMASAFNIQAQVFDKNGKSVVNTQSNPSTSRYRSAGIILNLNAKQVKPGENYYYIVINNSDIKNGWIVGMKYKVQLRLSTVLYNPNTHPKQEVWLQEFSNSFSEWSSYTYTKAISNMTVQVPLFDYDSSDSSSFYNENTVYTLADVDLFGSIFNENSESNELYDTFRVCLYKNDTLIEDSGDVDRISLGNESESYFRYKFKTKFQQSTEYMISLSFITINKYSLDKPLVFRFVVSNLAVEENKIFLTTIDDNKDDLLADKTTLEEEEDEGRIGLKLYSQIDKPWYGNICIRRASQEDNFATWEDIAILVIKEKVINDLDIYYDYTIQSGVWYKYATQIIGIDGARSELNEIVTPIQRLFNYSFLLGQNNQQLKLQFDNTISSFKDQILDSKTETIGSKYPYISRNAIVNYKTFPINALITYWMDEYNTFLSNGKKDIYNYDNIVELYDNYAEEHNRYQYDYTYEKDFRELVLKFLEDGKPKLFKSPTEGNIIVRLMNVSCSPNQSLDRMIYSVSMNADEIADNTMENYLKYGFYNPGEYGTDFSTSSYYIGQIDGKFNAGNNAINSDNIFKKIYEKYDSQTMNKAGFTQRLTSISRIKITINGYYMNVNGVETYIPNHQMRIKNNSGDLVVGNNLLLNYLGGNETLITIYDPRGIYEFDSLLTFYYTGDGVNNDSLCLLNDDEGLVTAINATVDFVYSLTNAPYRAHDILLRTPRYGIGQFYEEVQPGTSITNILYYKHYVESNSVFKYLRGISSIEIEANPHTVFGIKDDLDGEIEYHEVNETGILRLYEISNIALLTYVGKRYLKEPYNESTVSEEIITEDVFYDDKYCIRKSSADVSITYRYVEIQGRYKP